MQTGATSHNIVGPNNVGCCWPTLLRPFAWVLMYNSRVTRIENSCNFYFTSSIKNWVLAATTQYFNKSISQPAECCCRFRLPVNSIIHSYSNVEICIVKHAHRSHHPEHRMHIYSTFLSRIVLFQNLFSLLLNFSCTDEIATLKRNLN